MSRLDEDNNAKVSLVILTYKYINNALKLASDLKKYVDEVIIINFNDKYPDKVNESNFKIITLPDLGVSFYWYKYIISLVRNDWIVVLEDDYEVSPLLLEKLRMKLQTSRAKAYRIYRINTYTGSMQPVILIFRKDVVIPNCVIHNHYFITSPYEDLSEDPKLFIIHKEEKLFNMKKIKKYTCIESYQIGYLVLKMVRSNGQYYNIEGRSFNISKYIPNIIKNLALKNKIVLFLLIIFFINIRSIISNISILNSKINLRSKVISILYNTIYNTYLLLYVFRETRRKLDIYYQAYLRGDFCANTITDQPPYAQCLKTKRVTH